MQSNGLLPQQSTGSRLPYYYSLPPSFTTEQDSLSLWFLVPGDPAPPAEVNIRSSHRIDGLKEAINEKRIRLGYQLVPGMVLWKVETPIPLCRRTGAERTAFARRIDEIRFPDPDSDEGMDGKRPVQQVEDVSHYWQKQPSPKHLHIVVQAPSIARPSRMGPEDKTEAPVDFCILWKKTWDRKDDNIPWFTLTEALRDDTLTVPVSVPKFFWVFSPPDTIAQTLKLDPRTVLVREDYNRVLNELFKISGWSDFAPPNRDLNPGAAFCNPFTRAKPQHKPSRIGFMLTGHTGTGKSTWLRILLVLRLCARLPTFYQVSDDQTILFTKKGAVLLPLDSDALDHYMKEERTAWVLVDSTFSTPPPKFTETGIFVVRTHSRSDRMERRDKYVGIELCRLALWSPAEIICAAPFQRIRHKEQSLIDFCNLHGWSAGEAYSNASNAAFEGEDTDVHTGDTSETLNPASTSSAPPDPDDEQTDEDDDGDGDGSGEEHRGTSEAGGASPGCSEEHPPNSPSRRSLRKSVQTVKVLEVGNKTKASKMKTVIKFLPYDPGKHSSWAKKCNRCAVRDAECFGPVYRIDGTLSSSERCHTCAAGHHRCEKGFFRKSSSTAHPSPPGDTILVRPRTIPRVDRPSASNVRPSTPKASSSTNASRKRPAVTQQVDNEPPFHKVARTSKTSLVPRHTGSDIPNNPYRIPPRTSPSSPNISHSEPPEDDPILIQLDSPEASIVGDHEERLRRLADIRRVYQKLQKDKGSERSASTNRGSTSVDHPSHPSTDERATIFPLDSLQQSARPASLPAGLSPIDILTLLQPFYAP